MTEDEMAGWHHRLDGLGFEWTLGVGDGQGGLACYDSWGCKESDMTEQLNWTELKLLIFFFFFNLQNEFTFWDHFSSKMKFTFLWFGNLWFGLQFELRSWHLKLSRASFMRTQDQSFCSSEEWIFISNQISEALVFFPWDLKKENNPGILHF